VEELLDHNKAPYIIIIIIIIAAAAAATNTTTTIKLSMFFLGLGLLP